MNISQNSKRELLFQKMIWQKKEKVWFFFPAVAKHSFRKLGIHASYLSTKKWTFTYRFSYTLQSRAFRSNSSCVYNSVQSTAVYTHITNKWGIHWGIHGSKVHCKYIFIYIGFSGVPVQHCWALLPEYFLNLALFHLKIPKSTTQGPHLQLSVPQHRHPKYLV